MASKELLTTLEPDDLVLGGAVGTLGWEGDTGPLHPRVGQVVEVLMDARMLPDGTVVEHIPNVPGFELNGQVLCLHQGRARLDVLERPARALAATRAHPRRPHPLRAHGEAKWIAN